MASNTITVKPRKKTSGIGAPRRTAVQTNITQGTVLLQNPLPKYAFDLKSNKSANKQIKDEARGQETHENSMEKAESMESDIRSILDGQNYNQKSQVKLTHAPTDLNNVINGLATSSSKDKPVNKVGPITTTWTTTQKPVQSVIQSSSNSLTSTGVVCVTDISPAISVSENQNSHTKTSLPSPSASEVLSNNGTQSETVSESVINGAGNQIVGSKLCGCNCQDRVQHLEEEKQMLRNQLDVQLQVNEELKKLLVASVGDDLQHRVERLTRDRALMTVEIGDYSKKMVEDYENLDKISIQADMWRSKYLACRVMSDELASSRAFYTMQFQECQMALQQLLNERHELRINLYETYRGLQLIQGAFDPLKSQSSISYSLTSRNILDLARTNQHLVDSIKYRLLPSNVTSIMTKQIELDWNDYLTPAESHARQLMSREMRPEDFRHMATTPLPPGAMSVDRYHPFQNFDNLTLNVCRKCKGDISVV